MAVVKAGDVFQDGEPARTACRSRAQRVLATLSLGVPILVVIVGCQLVGGYQSFVGGDGGGSPSPCDVLPPSKRDEKGLATLVLSKPLENANCYWIDQTEVTVDEYSNFVAAAAEQQVAWDSERCSWKQGMPSDPASEAAQTSDCTATILQNGESDPFRSTKPIRCVDWCDALAFCNWAGKDLCWGFTNGAAGLVQPYDVPDRWGEACSRDGFSYPRGPAPAFGQCNVGFSQTEKCLAFLAQTHCGPTDVDKDKFSMCKGTSGALDMIGNVAEWVMECGSSGNGSQAQCQYRGGSFADSLDSADATCFGSPTKPISTRDPGIGFRCCAGLTRSEQDLVKKGATRR